MPPMISDDESMSDGIDVPEEVPAKATTTTKGKGKAPAKPVSEDEQEDGSDDDEEAEDEYAVDKILDHKVTRGVVQYKVKWLGYEDDADCTWEPASNLETAALKVKEYHSSIGGTPQPGSTKKGKKGAQKRTASEALESPAPVVTKKRGGRKSQSNGTDSEQSPFVLPKGSWESEVSHVMSIVEEPEPDAVKPGKTNKILMGFIEWNDGRKSKHPMKTLRTKCPQALLTYYENHLVFAKTEDVPAHLKTDAKTEDAPIHLKTEEGK